MSSPILLPYQRSFWHLTRCHKVVIWVAARQIGKTTTLVFWAVARAISGRNVVIISASLNTCTELMERVRDVVSVLYPGARPRGLKVRLPTGGKIIGIAANPRTARGWSADVIFDEADYFSDPRALWRAAYPITTRGYKVLVASSPLCEGSWCHEMVLAAGQRGYGVQTTSIYDAVDDGLVVDTAELQVELDDQLAWEAEYECVFSSSRELYFPLETVAAAQTEDLPVSGDAYGGCDIGRTTDWTVLTVLRQRGRQLVVTSQEVLANVRYQAQLDIIVRWIQRHNLRMTAIDARGVGAPLAELLEERCPGRIDPIRGDAARWGEDLCGLVRLLLDRGTLQIPHDRELVRDFRSVRRTKDGNLETKRGRRGGHGDRFWSLAYAVHAATEWGSAGQNSRVVRPPMSPAAYHRRIRA